jgi:hypothetical protein
MVHTYKRERERERERERAIACSPQPHMCVTISYLACQAELKAASVSKHSISAGMEEPTASTTAVKPGHNTNTSTLAAASEEPTVTVDANGTVTVVAGTPAKNDFGSIGEDGKRHGELGEVPSFAGPIIMAVLGILGFVGVCVYMTYFSNFGKTPPKSAGSGRKGTQA